MRRAPGRVRGPLGEEKVVRFPARIRTQVARDPSEIRFLDCPVLRRGWRWGSSENAGHRVSSCMIRRKTSAIVPEGARTAFLDSPTTTERRGSGGGSPTRGCLLWDEPQMFRGVA